MGGKEHFESPSILTFPSTWTFLSVLPSSLHFLGLWSHSLAWTPASSPPSPYNTKPRPQHMHTSSSSAAGTLYLEVGWQVGGTWVTGTGQWGRGEAWGRAGSQIQSWVFREKSKNHFPAPPPKSTLLSGSYNSPMKSDDKIDGECLGSWFYPWLSWQYPSNPLQLKLKTCSLCASHSWFTSIKNKPQNDPAFMPVLAQHKSRRSSGFCFQKIEDATGRESPPSENTAYLITRPCQFRLSYPR